MGRWYGQKVVWTYEPEHGLYGFTEELSSFAANEDDAWRVGWIHWLVQLTYEHGALHPYSDQMRVAFG